MQAPDRRGTSPSDIAVELSGVHKIYRQRRRSEHLRDVFRNLVRPDIQEVHALAGVDLVVRRGEIVAYAGPNGAGKSTTVKLLSSLLAPERGTVRALGLDPVRDRARYVGRIGVVFGQRTELWWDHPVLASFDWKRVVWDIPRQRFETMLGVAREVLGIGEFERTLTRELSLGQRMRADLALALLHEPELLLLDEPTLGLDVLARRRILDFLRELNRSRGTTVLVTSHDMSELEQLAGRIVMIHRGGIAFDGDFEGLRRRVSPRRILRLELDRDRSDGALELDGAECLGGSGRRFEYAFDASRTTLAELLAQASRQATLVDVETHRAPIDEVVADLYENWQRS